MRFFYVFCLSHGLLALMSSAAAAQPCAGSYASGSAYYPPSTAYYGSAPAMVYQQPAYAAPAPAMAYQQPAYAAPIQRRTYYAPPMYQPSQPAYRTPRPTTTITIGTYDDFFKPTTINVQPGTTVRWVNRGRHTHTVTADDRSWDSGDLQPGATYSATFKHPGTYYYYCRHHTQQQMRGTIVVGRAAAGGNAAGGSPAGGNAPGGGAGASGY